jgi:hypothetical protein
MNELNASEDRSRKIIIERFEKNLRGRKFHRSTNNDGHDGSEGHWVESMMEVRRNNSNRPDLEGFELKHSTNSKTTFGDWCASDIIFKKKSRLFRLTRSNFLKIFGKPNAEKNGRCSWSGQPFPKLGDPNYFGQWLEIDAENNISAFYDYTMDRRVDKSQIVPLDLQVRKLCLAIWLGSKLKKCLERKFNQNGWCLALKNSAGVYTEIAFGRPITFEAWIGWFKIGKVYLDNGMYDGNLRPYAQWRADNSFWHDLLIRSEES